MQTISLSAVASYLPEKIVENDFFGDMTKFNKNRMFEGVLRRRHVAQDETAVDMIEKAAKKLFEKTNLNPAKDIDLLLTNVSVPDQPFLGCGALVSKRIGACPQLILDLNNSGCISFVYMMEIACSLMRMGRCKHALICNVQNAAGQIFSQSEIRLKPQSPVPGDGCGVSYLTFSDDNPILATAVESHPDYATDMYYTCEDGRKYWEAGSSQVYIDFDQEKITTVIRRGNTLVPAVIKKVCASAGLSHKEIDALITNQPNPFFLRNWRESIELPAEKHFDTFSEYGNLFGAALPINLDEAIHNKKIKPGSNLVMAGFSHAGDFSAGAVIRWNKN